MAYIAAQSQSYDDQDKQSGGESGSSSSMSVGPSSGVAASLPAASPAQPALDIDLLASLSDIAAARSPIAETKSIAGSPAAVSSAGRAAPKTRSDTAAARAAMQVAELQQQSSMQQGSQPFNSSSSSSGVAPRSTSSDSASGQPAAQLSGAAPTDAEQSIATSAANTHAKTRRQALQTHTPSHPTQGIARHTEYDPSTGQNVTTTKVYLICRHDCGCKRRGSDLSLLTAPRACSSRGARHDHETNPALHPWCSEQHGCFYLISGKRRSAKGPARASSKASPTLHPTTDNASVNSRSPADSIGAVSESSSPPTVNLLLANEASATSSSTTAADAAPSMYTRKRQRSMHARVNQHAGDYAHSSEDPVRPPSPVLHQPSNSLGITSSHTTTAARQGRSHHSLPRQLQDRHSAEAEDTSPESPIEVDQGASVPTPRYASERSESAHASRTYSPNAQHDPTHLVPPRPTQTLARALPVTSPMLQDLKPPMMPPPAHSIGSAAHPVAAVVVSALDLPAAGGMARSSSSPSSLAVLAESVAVSPTHLTKRNKLVTSESRDSLNLLSSLSILDGAKSQTALESLTSRQQPPVAVKSETGLAKPSDRSQRDNLNVLAQVSLAQGW